MAFEYNKLTQAPKRPLTPKERLGLFAFILKFFLSKFGIFILFLGLNILPSFLQYSENKYKVFQRPQLSLENPEISTSRKLGLINNSPQATGSAMEVCLKPAIHNIAVQTSRSESEVNLQLEVQTVNGDSDKKRELKTYFSEEEKASLQKFKNYCIIATIVTLFLNPQQTKYFGGLAVALKQAGFFSKYSRSEKTVYFLSWIFIFVFFYSSFLFQRNLIFCGKN